MLVRFPTGRYDRGSRQKGGHELLESEFGSGLAIVSLSSALGGRKQKASRIVQALAYQFGQQDFVALRVGGVFEFWKDLKVGLLRLDGPRRAGTFLEQHHVAEPGASGRLESTLAICRPDVRCATNGFLGSIVVVLAE